MIFHAVISVSGKRLVLRMIMLEYKVWVCLARFMLRHGLHCLFEMFLLLNLGLFSSVKMPPIRLHTRPHIHRSLQNCSSQADVLALSSENGVQNSWRASSPQSVHSTVHIRPTNFTGTRSPSVFDLQVEGKLQSRLISVWRI